MYDEYIYIFFGCRFLLEEAAKLTLKIAASWNNNIRNFDGDGKGSWRSRGRVRSSFRYSS